MISAFELLLDAAINFFFGSISLPLPTIELNLADPLVAVRNAVTKAAGVMQTEINKVITVFEDLSESFLPEDFSLEPSSYLPADLGGCLDAECIFTLDQFGPNLADAPQLATDFANRMKSVDPSFIEKQFKKYILSINGCNKYEKTTVSMVQYLPSDLQVDECNIGDPIASVCSELAVDEDGDAIFQNLSDTFESIMDLSPNRLRMLRRSLATDYFVKEIAFELISITISLKEIGAIFLLPVLNFTNTLINRDFFCLFPRLYLSVHGDMDFVATFSAILTFRLFETPIAKFGLGILIGLTPSASFKRYSQSTEGWENNFREVFRDVDESHFKAYQQFEDRCSTLKPLNIKGTCQRWEQRLKVIISDYQEDKGWSKSFRLRVESIDPETTSPDSLRRVILKLTSSELRDLIGLLRRHVRKVKDELERTGENYEDEWQKALRREKSYDNQKEKKRNFENILSQIVKFDGTYLGVIFHPSNNPNVSNGTGIVVNENVVSLGLTAATLIEIPLTSERITGAGYFKSVPRSFVFSISLGEFLEGELLNTPIWTAGVSSRTPIAPLACLKYNKSQSIFIESGVTYLQCDSISSTFDRRVCEIYREVCLDQRDHLSKVLLLKITGIFGVGSAIRGKPSR